MTLRKLTSIATTVLAAAALIPASALADGDPASDVLLGENVFYPYTPPVSAALQKTLNTETAAARRAHFPIKVALIASPADLGMIPDLFNKPQKYADFLDQEISFQNKQLLLVVMPAGYGVQGLPATAISATASLSQTSRTPKQRSRPRRHRRHPQTRRRGRTPHPERSERQEHQFKPRLARDPNSPPCTGRGRHCSRSHRSPQQAIADAVDQPPGPTGTKSSCFRDSLSSVHDGRGNFAGFRGQHADLAPQRRGEGLRLERNGETAHPSDSSLK